MVGDRQTGHDGERALKQASCEREQNLLKLVRRADSCTLLFLASSPILGEALWETPLCLTGPRGIPREESVSRMTCVLGEQQHILGF